MKKLILWLLTFLILPAMVMGAISIKSGTNTNLELYCYNATSGDLLGSAATLTCKDGAFNTELNGVTLTNVATGKFNYTFNEEEDILSCIIDCAAGCVDTSFYLEVRPDYLAVADNVGINWGDVSNPSTAVDLSATDIQVADTCTDLTNPVDLNSTLLTSITNIEEDTNELQSDDYPASFTKVYGAISGNSSNVITYLDPELAQVLQAIIGNSSEWDNVADVSSLALQSDLLAVGEDVNSSLTNQNTIDTNLEEVNQTTQASLTDTNELQTNQGNWVTATGFSTLENATSIISDIATAQADLDNPNQYKATGFSTHSVEDVWSATITNSSKSANLTIGEIWYIVYTSQLGLTANWTGQSGALSLSASDISDIALGVVNETVNATYPGNEQALGTRMYYTEIMVR